MSQKIYHAIYNSTLAEENYRDSIRKAERELSQSINTASQSDEFALIEKRLRHSVEIINSLILKRFHSSKGKLNCIPEISWTQGNLRRHTYKFFSYIHYQGLYVKGEKGNLLYVPEIFYKGSDRDIASYARNILYSVSLREIGFSLHQAETNLVKLENKKIMGECFRQDPDYTQDPNSPVRRLIDQTIDDDILRAKRRIFMLQQTLKKQSMKYAERINRV